jgi:2-(1,2-epoxy-1,2-dihydrophenyl)acetyl-CoA isomerase
MVDGAAAGAGCNLALACDLVVASDRARFGEVFARIGLVPDAGGTYFLPRRVGLARAKELVFTADIIDAREAERIGLINRVVPAADLETETLALARRIVDGPPRVLAAAKTLLDRAPGLDLESALHWGGADSGSDDCGSRPSRGPACVLRKASASLHGWMNDRGMQVPATKAIPNP